MAATVSRADTLSRVGDPNASEARDLADLFCRIARRRVKQLFRDLWNNDDAQRYRSALDVLEGRHAWLEKGIMAHASSTSQRAPERTSEPAGVA